MAYASFDGLRDRYGADMILRLTEREADGGVVQDPAAIDRAIVDTDALIDGYLRGRYVTPLIETPPQIADIALSIAIYKLHRWSPEQKIRDDYDDALKLLREIAAGTAHLTAATIAPVLTGGSGARMTDRERPLTAENLKGYI